MVTKIILIRHGDTQWSLSGKHTGKTDLPLTEGGEQRASSLRPKLQEIAFDHVFTSPLQRARRTCELAGLGAVAQVDPNLHEWDYGAYEGLTTGQIRALQPGWGVFKDGCPKGESVEQVCQRADAVLDRLRALGGTIAVFSHGHFSRSLGVRWIGLPLLDGQRFSLGTATLSVLGFAEHDAEAPAISVWNAGSLS
jgi:probable phosphoglycerate mutase